MEQFLENNYLYFGICCGVAVLCLIMLIISLVKKQKKYTLILLVEANDRFYSFSKLIEKNQDYKECFKPLSDVYIMIGDVLMRCLYRTRPYEAVPGSADALYEKWSAKAEKQVQSLSITGYHRLLKNIVKEFDGKKIYKLVLDEDNSLISKEEISNLRA